MDFNFGEWCIPAGVYAQCASYLFDTDVSVHYNSAAEEYPVKGEFCTYDGINLTKHALHNTIPDISKSKMIIDSKTGEDKQIKVRYGETIQLENSKIEEIQQHFSEWLTLLHELFTTLLC